MVKFESERFKGLTIQEIFEIRYRGKNIEFQDLLMSNRHLDFPPDEVVLDTFITPKIPLKIPFISSPMDTVTTARMAIGMADSGGIGIIHTNFENFQQRREVGKVKFGGLVINPLVLSPSMRVEFLEFVRTKYSHLPITENGNPDSKLLGMITKSFRLSPHHETMEDCLKDANVKSPVTVLRGHILYPNGVVIKDKALSIMREKNTTALAVVEENGCLFGLIIRSDLDASSDSSKITTLDEKGCRRVGAAITTLPEDYERRVPRLVESGTDVLCIDTAHGDSKFVGGAVTWIKKEYPHIELIAGNVSTADGAKFLANAGADAVRAGNGPGGACSTHEVTHTGASSAVGIYRVCAALHDSGKLAIADGGIRNSGDIFIALALGANSVMAGTYLAALKESAAPLRSVMIEGKRSLRKVHRGMASEAAQRERVVVRYGAEQIRAPEGEELYLEPEQRPLPEFIALTMAGVRQAFAYAGVRSISELHQKVRSGEIRFDLAW